VRLTSRDRSLGRMLTTQVKNGPVSPAVGFIGFSLDSMLSSKRSAVATIPSRPILSAWQSVPPAAVYRWVPLIDCASLTPVPASQRQIITNLMQLYENDFLEFA